MHNERVLIIYSTFNKARPMGDPSVWYRCYNFAEKLQSMGIICDLVSEDDQLDVIDYLEYYVKVIFFRPRQSSDFLEVVTEIKRLRIPLYASYDDFIFEPSSYTQSSTLKSNARRELIHSRYRDWANAFEIFDDFIVSSEFLKSKVHELKENSIVHLIENWLPNRLIAKFGIAKERRDVLKVGYFGGGISHLNDILDIQDELISLSRTINVEFHFPELIVDGLSEELKFKCEPFERLTYVDMLEHCHNVDVAIAPLIIDSNSSAKSAIKYTEAIACNTPLVATHISSYDSFENLDGLYYAEKGSWCEKIILASQQKVSLEARNEILQKLDARVTDSIKRFMGKSK